jgi:hypothetical protein
MAELNTDQIGKVAQFDLPNALATHYKLQQQQQDVNTQNALAQAVPMLQSDPQNAFATAAKTSSTAALQLLPVIKQMDDQKKAKLAESADAFGKLAYNLKQYSDPMVRRAVALSQAPTLAQHGVTADQIQNFDYSDQNIQAAINNTQTTKDLIAQSNNDRTYTANRSDHADTLNYQNKTLAGQAATRAETATHDRATEHQAANAGDFGRSINGKAYNILAQGLKDPTALSTPEYATAWQILSNPHVDPNTGTVVVPDLSAFKPPAGAQGSQAGAGPAQRMPSIQSFAPPNPSQPEAQSAGFANRLAEAAGIIDQTEAAQTSLGQVAKSKTPVVGNYLVSTDFQKADQARRNFVNAQLRRESGAAIADSEFKNAEKQYFPQPGDSKEVLAQKKASRDMAVRNMQLSAGNTLLPPGVIQNSSPPRGAQMVPQQQGFGASGPANNDPLGIRH